MFRRALFLLMFSMIGSFALTGPGRADTVVPSSTAQIELSFAPVVKRVAPSVVNIYTRKVVQEQLVSPFFNDPFFRQFFGDESQFGRPRERVQNSLGSGVILRADGLVVTNNHVIKGADQITVVLNDGREFEAKVIAAEEQLDLALLRVDTKGEKLPPLELRDSDDLEVGDLVLAIGNPFGVGQTVTSGIVSGLARTRTGINDFGFFIQTDAAINPGNSGGALVTMDGRVVGINTAIFSKTGGSVGIGFAIPSNMVKAMISAEANGGKFVRPWIGASGEELTAEIAKSLGLPKPGGVVIKQVYPDGPAVRAGIKPGDVITAVNGKPVNDPEALRFRLATLQLGTPATLEIMSRGESREVKIDLIAAPKTPAPDEQIIKGRNPLSGAVVANLSPALSEELSIAPWSGVVVTKVRRGSFADQFNLQPGDVIMKLNNHSIDTVEQLVEAVAKEADEWLITINRGGQVKTLRID
ncbi:DegQ family serine endoprotease [Dongia soli]|uniref:DegQ family serine endoprotease n=1 Tax=Dongia soli TaxID=600628 RepID=A0ABU5EJC9_9PROT|nr:DegQ family serine endoprotease [Dongia soli]MDY0885847.1 DegQ family serine endoprotease [Dongia soli]